MDPKCGGGRPNSDVFNVACYLLVQDHHGRRKELSALRGIVGSETPSYSVRMQTHRKHSNYDALKAEGVISAKESVQVLAPNYACVAKSRQKFDFSAVRSQTLSFR